MRLCKCAGLSEYVNMWNIYFFSYFVHKNIYCGYSLEAPHWGASNEYPQYMFSWRNKKTISTFRLKKVLQNSTTVLTGLYLCCSLFVLGFNNMSTLVGHFVSSPREREKRDRRDSRKDEREGQGRKRNRNESEETEENKTFPHYPYLLQG